MTGDAAGITVSPAARKHLYLRIGRLLDLDVIAVADAVVVVRMRNVGRAGLDRGQESGYIQRLCESEKVDPVRAKVGDLQHAGGIVRRQRGVDARDASLDGTGPPL